jgi:hypothetical protein
MIWLADFWPFHIQTQQPIGDKITLSSATATNSMSQSALTESKLDF